MLKVLVVDGISVWDHLYLRQFEGYPVKIISARSAAEAERMFASHPDVAAIALGTGTMDAPTTLHLPAMFRETFTGPIIGISTDPAYRQLLMEAGCSHQADKIHLVALLLHLFCSAPAHHKKEEKQP